MWIYLYFSHSSYKTARTVCVWKFKVIIKFYISTKLFMSMKQTKTWFTWQNQKCSFLSITVTHTTRFVTYLTLTYSFILLNTRTWCSDSLSVSTVTTILPKITADRTYNLLVSSTVPFLMWHPAAKWVVDMSQNRHSSHSNKILCFPRLDMNCGANTIMFS